MAVRVEGGGEWEEEALTCPVYAVLYTTTYGTDSVFGGSTSQEQWWRFSLYLSVSSLVGGGCWLRAYDVQRRGLCIRASHQYCTEAMSKVGCNSSPILTWKIISNCEVLCYNECFSDHGICLADFGRLECRILRARTYYTGEGMEPTPPWLSWSLCSTIHVVERHTRALA